MLLQYVRSRAVFMTLLNMNHAVFFKISEGILIVNDFGKNTPIIDVCYSPEYASRHVLLQNKTDPFFHLTLHSLI